MEYSRTPYYRIGSARDLSGRDAFTYRFLEMVPGVLAWSTVLSIFFFSIFYPFYASVFIIVFAVYWILKSFYLSIHLYHAFKKTKHNLEMNWQERMSHVRGESIRHLILLPYYNESLDIIRKSLTALAQSRYDLSKFIIVLAGEERKLEHTHEVREVISREFSGTFGQLFFTVHPKGLPEEIPGKGSNIAYAAQQVKTEILDTEGIQYEDVIVSAFDIDTVVYPDYFSCLTWNFLTTEYPYRSSFQPIAVFNNNVWDAPMLSRVVAFSSTFWQMIQQERRDKLTTFSSHAVSFKALVEIGFWQKNMVAEDSRIFWNAFLAYNGDYRVVPLHYPVAMDANLAETFGKTLWNIYKQQRRWAWGAEDFPYIMFGFLKNKDIPLGTKIKHGFIVTEGLWSWATNPVMLFFLGWTPTLLGGREFNSTILSYNLSDTMQVMMTVSMIGLLLSAWVARSFLPEAPKHAGVWAKTSMFLQWAFIPITSTLFGSIPALDAQTRLLFGKYMGFWVTPKHRK